MLYGLLYFMMLSHPDYEVREHATRTIEHLVDGWPWHYGPLVCEWRSRTACPEAFFRARRAVGIYERWRVNTYVPKVPVWPCCDMMPLATAWGDRRVRALGMPWFPDEEFYGKQHRWDAPPLNAAPYWHRYRKGTERMVRKLLFDGATHDEVDALLARMWAIELAANCDSPEGYRDEILSWDRWEGGYPKPR